PTSAPRLTQRASYPSVSRRSREKAFRGGLLYRKRSTRLPAGRHLTRGSIKKLVTLRGWLGLTLWPRGALLNGANHSNTLCFVLKRDRTRFPSPQRGRGEPQFHRGLIIPFHPVHAQSSGLSGSTLAESTWLPLLHLECESGVKPTRFPPTKG